MCDGESLCSEYRTTFKNSKTAILTDKLGIIYFLKIQMGGKFKKKKKIQKTKGEPIFHRSELICRFSVSQRSFNLFPFK